MFFLQTSAFYRASTVSPASARFPVTMGMRLAIGHRAVPGETSLPTGIYAICSGFSCTGRRAERYPYRNFFGFPGEGVGVALWPLPAVAVKVARLGERHQDFFHRPVRYPLHNEVPALETMRPKGLRKLPDGA